MILVMEVWVVMEQKEIETLNIDKFAKNGLRLGNILHSRFALRRGIG